MIRSSRLVGMASVAVVISVALFVHTQATEPADVPPKDFGDGVLMLLINRQSGIETKKSTRVFTNASLVKMGDRFFARGKVWIPKNNKDAAYQRGMDGGVAWQDVAEFYIMTEEAMEQFATEHWGDKAE